MSRRALAVLTLAASAVLAVPGLPAHATVASTTPAWVGPTPTGGDNGYQLDPVTTPSGFLRANETIVPGTETQDYPTFQTTFQRYTSTGWGASTGVASTQVSPEDDAAVFTGDDTHVRIVQPYYDSSSVEHLTFIQAGTTTTSTPLGAYDFPSLATDSSGSSMVLYENLAGVDALIATPVAADGTTLGTPHTLQADDFGNAQVVATGAGTFLAVWTTTTATPATYYSTYAAGTWSAPASVGTFTIPIVVDLISAAGRQVVEMYDVDSGVTSYSVFNGATWTATSARDKEGQLAAGPDGTIYAGGSTLGTLPLASTTWSEGLTPPGTPTGQTCDDSTHQGYLLAWDNAIGGLRTLQGVLTGLSCEMDTWTLGSRTTGTSLYTPLSPKRVLDTRSGLGAPRKAVGAGTSVVLSFAGKIPADATAVALNIAGTGGTADTYVTGYPTGTGKPTASSLNLVKGQTAAALGIFKLGTNQSVTLTNYAGSLQIIGDLAGYEGPAGLKYTPLTPQRVLRTTTPLGKGGTLSLDLTGIVPADATAVVLNVSGTQTTAPTYLSTYPAGSARPSASTVNIAANDTTTNLAMLKLGTHQALTVFNDAGSTQVVGDLAGYYSASATDGYVPLAPARVLDTRKGIGVAAGARSPGSTFTLSLASAVPSDATAVAIMITGVLPNHPSYVSAYPAGAAKPSASTVNITPGRATGNLAVVKLGTAQSISLFEGIGTEHVVGDLVGYYR